VRIGVFGGTFDPPHVGHLILAADAIDALNLDKLVLVPAHAQPLKVETPAIASSEERLQMVELAVAGDDRYSVDDAEIRRPGLSFTVDTLEELARRNRGAELFLLVGEDSLRSFDRWRNPGRIRELATLAVMHRSGSAEPLTVAHGKDFVMSTRRVDVSSTEIRERLRAGKSVRGFVPDAVGNFIRERGLYR
jgi:nicotinate-nucleotide adenylyltransferase